jgi:hypothetical protein
VGWTYFARFTNDIRMHDFPALGALVKLYARVKVLDLNPIDKHTGGKVAVSQHHTRKDCGRQDDS